MSPRGEKEGRQVIGTTGVILMQLLGHPLVFSRLHELMYSELHEGVNEEMDNKAMGGG